MDPPRAALHSAANARPRGRRARRRRHPRGGPRWRVLLVRALGRRPAGAARVHLLAHDLSPRAGRAAGARRAGRRAALCPRVRRRVERRGRRAPRLIGKLAVTDRARVPAGIEVVPVVFLREEVLRRGAARLGPHRRRSVGRGPAPHGPARGDPARAAARLRLDRRQPRRVLRAARAVREQSGLPLSSTIRLHQIKYRERTGVPPVERGMLMFYNMGQFSADPEARAIFDPGAPRATSRRWASTRCRSTWRCRSGRGPCTSATAPSRGSSRAPIPTKLAALLFLRRGGDLPDLRRHADRVPPRDAAPRATSSRSRSHGPARGARRGSPRSLPHLAAAAGRTVTLFDLSEGTSPAMLLPRSIKSSARSIRSPVRLAASPGRARARVRARRGRGPARRSRRRLRVLRAHDRGADDGRSDGWPASRRRTASTTTRSRPASAARALDCASKAMLADWRGYLKDAAVTEADWQKLLTEGKPGELTALAAALAGRGAPPPAYARSSVWPSPSRAIGSPRGRGGLARAPGRAMRELRDVRRERRHQPTDLPPPALLAEASAGVKAAAQGAVPGAALRVPGDADPVLSAQLVRRGHVLRQRGQGARRPVGGPAVARAVLPRRRARERRSARARDPRAGPRARRLAGAAGPRGAGLPADGGGGPARDPAARAGHARRRCCGAWSASSRTGSPRRARSPSSIRKSNLIALLLVRELARASRAARRACPGPARRPWRRPGHTPRSSNSQPAQANTAGADRPMADGADRGARGRPARRRRRGAAAPFRGRRPRGRATPRRGAGPRHARAGARARAGRWPRAAELELARTMTELDPKFARLQPVRDEVRGALAASYARAGKLAFAELLRAGSVGAAAGQAGVGRSGLHQGDDRAGGADLDAVRAVRHRGLVPAAGARAELAMLYLVTGDSAAAAQTSFKTTRSRRASSAPIRSRSTSSTATTAITSATRRRRGRGEPGRAAGRSPPPRRAPATPRPRRRSRSATRSTTSRGTATRASCSPRPTTHHRHARRREVVQARLRAGEEPRAEGEGRLPRVEGGAGWLIYRGRRT